MFSNASNTKTHIGDEIDVAYTRMFADGKVVIQAAYGTIFAGGYLTSTLDQTQNQHWAYMSLWMNFWACVKREMTRQGKRNLTDGRCMMAFLPDDDKKETTQ